MSKKELVSRAREAFADLLSVDLDTCEIQLCLASVPKEESPDIQQVSLHTDVVKEFVGIARKQFESRKADLEDGDLVLHPYAPQAKLDSHEVEFLSLGTYPSISTQISGLKDSASLDWFENEGDFLKSLRFYVIVITPKKGEPLLCFRTYSPKRQLGRSSLFAFVFHRGQFDSLTESVFLFDQYFDCVARGDDLFIFKKDQFQKIFQFYEELLKAGQQVLRAISMQVKIDGFTAFAKACERHLQKLAKLKNIASKPYFSRLTMADVKKVIQRYQLPVETVGTGDDEMIKFDEADKWAILRLLDDDYLESIMTGNSYEANSKRELE